MSDLRDRLVVARLVSHLHTMDDGYPSIVVHSEEEAADRAIAVVAEWLRRKAADVRATADLLPNTDEAEAIGAAKMLDFLADALAGGEDANQPAD